MQLVNHLINLQLVNHLVNLQFICLALYIMSCQEKEMCFSMPVQLIALTGIVFFSLLLLYRAPPIYMVPNVCSTAILFVIAVTDAQTGYIYNCFGYGSLIICSMLALENILLLSESDFYLLYLYLVTVNVSAVLGGMGAGDVPIYFSLMFYYIRYLPFPAEASLFLLLLSQIFFGVGAMMQRKKKMPLVPYICLAHLMILSLWIP